MILSSHCPACQQSLQTPVTPGAIIDCPSCHWRRTISPEDLQAEVSSSADVTKLKPTRCLSCGNDDLWRQKDFPARWGVIAAGTAAVLSSVAWYYYRPAWALGILLVFAAADWLLFAILPDLLVCYRCQARHHGVDAAGREAFHLELAERYRQEAARLQAATADTKGLDRK